MDAIASHILALPPWVALLLIFLLPALESSAFVGFVFPGETALILGGVLAFRGVVPLWAVLVAGILGAIIGDSVGYAVGRRWGRNLIHGTLGRLINRKHLDRGERYLAERGGRAVFLGRFTAALRVMIPGLAGMARLRYPLFLAYNAAGAVCWGTMCVLLGYLGGRSWQRVAHLASRIGFVAVGVVVALVVIGYLIRRARWGWALRALERLQHAPAVVRFTGRYPRTTAWVVARFDARRPEGLALTTLVGVAVSSIWITLGLGQDVVDHEEFALLDHPASLWVVDHRIGWLTAILQVLTWFGSNAVIGPLLIIAGILLVRQRRSWLPAADIIVTYLGTMILYAVIKNGIERPRPPTVDRLTRAAGWLAQKPDWAFPSGHAAQATAAWVLLCVLIWNGRSAKIKIRLAAATAALVLLVSFSRWYLGVAWLTDVLAGMTLGLAVLGVWGITRITIAGTDPEVITHQQHHH
ncbi:bifunctional DedA family/phosphatase PAP2 family protein [Microlunatus sp. Gsoil 973]|uniref:bifunctional DedA family/phosphatase PAP2 family protein n=1 Tax=Microlunatus sp. Gsoil 973 TaxID=2672569 RepID=UPI0012B4D810|nr:bifunctional DedA family/phosphatase PAP2 family protein [Microlunatus sp. Gsoil 973]QGN34027.1 phosphatase PAP2 family protein [Microlunatus sp. Gsoil 973]